MHICKFDFMPGYDVWMYNGETIHQRIASVAEDEDDRSGDDRIYEMLDAIRPELETNHEDPPTSKVQMFFEMLRASEEPLHEHMTVNVLTFVTRITSIKSKFAFSNKCYKELLSMFNDVLPSNHKILKDMYQSKKLLSALGMEYEKIDVCKDNCMIFYKEHKNEMKYLKCGKPRFVEVVNEDGEKVTIKTTHKQLRYMPLTPRMQQLFISKKTARHMR
jgi:tRNA A37 N6-isopentenylltransferase MiaA